ncbi:addiction module antidote protein, HigA family [Pedobacter psychrodurus]|uniref:Addiction module antidote protein, HigA family n=1 Tax=Pedobacter psychrodurus TaxID=2530456 RepID=A0A4V2MR99_9SPHI|nr:HigA family addiction module antitoxin [Pedobacter psychrodurus]TCD28647.1 addiction module antidote protein, HigA family [Pedobacter psychrodurus]
MEKAMIRYQGIHPGLILGHELEKRGIKKRPFALSLSVLPQTINDITKGRRRLTPAISLKIDRALGFEEGTMLLLQAHYDLKEEKERSPGSTPDLQKLRKMLFWDTDIDKIDWQRQANAIIQRVFERGNDLEKKTLLDFYGRNKIKSVTGRSGVKENRIPLMKTLKLK